MARSPNRYSGKLRGKAQVPAGGADVSGAGDKGANDHTAPAFPNLDDRLARELVRGLVRSASARGANPVARLQEFRKLQQAAAAISQDPIASHIAEQLVYATDLALQELLTAKS